MNRLLQLRNRQNSPRRADRRDRAHAHPLFRSLCSILVNFVHVRLAALLAVLVIVGSSTVAAQPQQAGPTSFRPYLVHVAEPNSIVLASDQMDELLALDRQRQRDDLSAALQNLASAGLVGDFSYDESERAFRAELTDTARDRLASNPLVASIELAPPPALPAQIASDASLQGVSSVLFVQVNSPFVWGRTNIGGLSVQLTLEDSSGNVKGVPTQGKAIDSIKIDRTQLYFETVFVTDSPSKTPVMIVPGDRVHMVTSGDDPGTPYLDPPEDKRIVVDDIRAWTSYEQDTVSGTAPANSTIIVTSNMSLSLSQYLTPGSSVTYAETASGSNGSFSVPTFRTTNDPTYKKVDLRQGSTGFVRLRHADGNEIYTVHGQNVLVLENSQLIHGWAFGLPSAPSPLEQGVTVARPATTVSITLKNSSGQVKETDSFPPPPAPTNYSWGFSSMIVGGDIVEVSINGGPVNQIVTAPLTARIDLGANQVTGTGPANTQMVVAAGRISGYITSNSSADYVVNRVSTNGSGDYTTGQFQCGTSNTVLLKPGSFGYAGYEDARGNFVYMAFAAPTNYVMSDYTFLEGWVADGTIRPDITLRDSNGGIKQSATTATPLMLYMTNQKVYINTYYNMTTSQYIVPGDTVTVVSGSQTHTIPVDKLTAYVNVDAETIDGQAPAGATVRVIPAKDRTSRREVPADSNGNYSAGNPFTSFSNSNCHESNKTIDFTPGDGGRVYLRHADGNEVFTYFGRAMHINENANYVELYLYVSRGLDWGLPPSRPVTVTLTPRQGAPVTVQEQSYGGVAGQTKVYIVDSSNQVVLIRVGDSLTATFNEGFNGPTRQVTLSINSLPLITASPDVETSTLAGVGPRNWPGTASLGNPFSNIKPVGIPPGSSTAYAPLRFVNSSGGQISLVQGYSGNVSFSNSTGYRIYIAWAVTAYQVKITGWPRPGDTQVCGKAPPNSTVRIHDVTIEGQDVIIGTGTSDGQGNFCVTTTPLYKGQVLLAEVDGTFSQPVIVTDAMPVYLPYTFKNYAGWNTNVVIQNLSGNSALVQVNYYDMDGGSQMASAAETMTIMPYSSTAIRPLNNPNLPNSKRYSIVAVADQPTAAIVNTSAAAPSRAMSYKGISQGTTSVYMPNIVRRYAGWDSPFYIQNASSSDGSVTIKFYRFSDGSLVKTLSGVNIKAGATYEVDPRNVDRLQDNTQYAVVVNGTMPLAAAVNQMDSLKGMSYSGFGSGSTQVYLPNITRNYSGWNTPFIIQNVSSEDASVTVKYYKFSDGSLAKTVGPFTVQPGRSAPQRPHQESGLQDNTQYSVVVASSRDVLVAVNQATDVAAMSYNGLAQGGTTVYLPNVTRNYFGWNTPFIIQNMSADNASVTVKYYRFSDGSLAKTVGPFTIQPGRSSPQRPHQEAGLQDNTQYSVVITSDRPIGAVVNQSNASGGDNALSYEGIAP